MHKLYRITGILAIALIASVAHAQTVGLQSPVQFVVYPEVPGPNEQVSIEAQGIGNFLGDASIIWQQNGKTVLSGVGDQDFSFTTGGVGSRTTIHIVINSPTQGTITKDLVFTPSVVHLLWEADTSVPPFYLGKALYSAGSRLKVVAIPQVISGGSYISPNSLSYQWTVDGNPVPASSGLGHSTIAFSGNGLKTAETISVEVSLAGTAVGEASLTIPAATPQILLYVKDPLRDVLYDQALPGSISLAGQEVTLRAEPYYFSTNSIASGAASYSWSLDGEPVTGPNTAQGLLTLRQTGSGEGESSVSIQLQNTDSNKLLQSAKAALLIMFGQTTSGSSPFGS